MYLIYVNLSLILPSLQIKLGEWEKIRLKAENITLKISPPFEKRQSISVYITGNFCHCLYNWLFEHGLYGEGKYQSVFGDPD